MASQTCPYEPTSTSRAESGVSGCPVDHSKFRSNLSSEDISDTANLSNIREKSSIPSISGEWYYPSPKQFYKAISQKGHLVDPSDVTMAVAIHNHVNEESWKRIMEYENLHIHKCENPRLIRFVGKPGALSLKARFNILIGFEGPFDRHDWLVDRCGKKQRYLIDFYDGKPKEGQPVSIYIDARPELSFGGTIDQIRLFFKNKFSFSFF